ncbi:MAG: methionyl-tRNA formyltransferase [Spartobacteria bacterium]|nr:methionyl-tRNA formyltransferase [Spartobacteria bacterium]
MDQIKISTKERPFMRIVFMGSDEIACPALTEAYHDNDIEIVAVITQPDRPKGRKRQIQPCDLKSLAQSWELPVFSPEKLSTTDYLSTFETWNIDLILVVAYGQYIPSRLIESARLRAINLHPSLLPKYRGASPIQAAIAAGEHETGISIVFVGKEMDAGDILLQETMLIDDLDNAVTMKDKLGRHGAKLLIKAAHLLDAGAITARPQDHDQSIYVKKLEKTDGLIDWNCSAEEILNRIRAYQPWPICYTNMPETPPMRIYAAIKQPEINGEPGTVVAIEKNGPIIATGQGGLCLTDVQPSGKKRMNGQQLINGRYLAAGTRL